MTPSLFKNQGCRPPPRVKLFHPETPTQGEERPKKVGHAEAQQLSWGQSQDRKFGLPKESRLGKA